MKIFLGTITSILVVFFLIFLFLSFLNNSNYWNNYYKTKDIKIQNYKVKNVNYNNEILKHVSAEYEKNIYEAYIRQPKKVKYVAILFTGRKTGKKAMGYLRLMFKNALIIAMDYPFEKKRYNFKEVIHLSTKVRNGFLNLPIVARHFLSQALEDKNSDIPILSVGVSFGGPFSYLLAAIDKRITGIIYCYGFSNIKEMLTMHLRYNFENYPLRLLAGILFDTLFYPLEPLRWIDSNKEKPTLFVKAKNDEDVPDKYINNLIAMHKNPEIKILPGSHLRTGDLSKVGEISEIIQTYLEKTY